MSSVLSFIQNDHKCKIQFIVWLFQKIYFIALKADFISQKKYKIIMASVMKLLVKCHVRCGHVIHMTLHKQTLHDKWSYSKITGPLCLTINITYIVSKIVRFSNVFASKNWNNGQSSIVLKKRKLTNSESTLKQVNKIVVCNFVMILV